MFDFHTQQLSRQHFSTTFNCTFILEDDQVVLYKDHDVDHISKLLTVSSAINGYTVKFCSHDSLYSSQQLEPFLVIGQTDLKDKVFI